MIRFFFHHLSISIVSARDVAQGDWILSQLRTDFGHFPQTPKMKVTTRIEVTVQNEIDPPLIRIPTFASKRLLRFWNASGSYFSGPDALRSNVTFDRCDRTMHVASSDARTTYEVIYQFVLSAIGEFMEASGFHRFHAMGFLFQNHSIVIPLPSGRGKSTMTSWLLENTEVQFLGDETIYTDGKALLPFPLRRALNSELPLDDRRFFNNKVFVPWPRSRLLEDPQTQWTLLLYRNVYSSRRFYWEFFWGLGNTQMMEYLLRLNNLGGLLKMAFSRIRTLATIHSRVLELPIWQTRPADNWPTIQQRFQSRQN